MPFGAGRGALLSPPRFRRSLLCGGFFRERFGSERFLSRRFPGRCIASSVFFPGSRFFSRRSFPRRGLLSGSCLSGSRCGGPGCFGRGISERFHFRGCQVARGFHQQFGRVGHRCCRQSPARRGGRCLRRLVQKRVKHLLARRAQRAIVARGTAALAPDDSALGHGRRNSRNLRNRHDRRGFNRRWIHWRQVDGGELVRRRLGGGGTAGAAGAAGTSSPRRSSSESLRPQHSQKCPGVIGSVTHSMQRKTVPPAGTPPGAPST